jgi:hypothetical protein
MKKIKTGYRQGNLLYEISILNPRILSKSRIADPPRRLKWGLSPFWGFI